MRRNEPLKASTVDTSFYMIGESSFLVLHFNRSMIPVYRPLLSLSSDRSHSESIHCPQSSLVKLNEYGLPSRGYQILRQRKATTHPGPQLPKKINNHLGTQRQIGDSQPFSPLELIAMYPERKPVPTKHQQTGD